MKKKRNFIFKMCSALLMALICIISFVIPTKAYYLDSNGNLVSENLFDNDFNYSSTGFSIVTVNQTTTINGANNNVTFLEKSISLESGNYYLSVQNSTDSNNTGLDVFIEIDNVRYNSNITISTSGSYSLFLRVELYSNVNYSFNIMLNSGTSSITYEPYGYYYSQTNYDNYYDTGYGIGYNAGINHAYNQLGSTIISPLVSGSSIAKYDTNNENFISRTNINDVYVSGDYYFLNWSADSDYWYHITLGWNDYYIIKDIGFTPGNFSSVIVTVNGIDFSNISYNGTFYGIFNIQDVTMTPVNQIIISVKMNTSTFSGVNLYVSSFNNGIEDVQEAFNNGYEQGIKVGKDNGYKLGYEDGYSEGSLQENTGRKLIWTIASTPFESFKTIWNVDVLGLNISGIILGLLMALLVIYLIKKIWK